MLRNSAALSIALLVCTLMLPMETAAAQQAGKTGLHDDTSGRLTAIPIRKENLAFVDASADLTFDVDYVYKSTTLVGEPLLLCGARLSNPKGTVSFTHRDTAHQVEVTPQNAEKINPHHLDLLVEYRLPHSRVVYASCDTGIVGTWAREAYNLSSSPSWGRFLCELSAPIVIAHYVSTRPRPNRIDREWCASMQGRYLEADAAKELFRGRELRASGFVVASLSLDVADLVLERTRTALAERIAQRMQAQLESALADSKPGMLASSEERETWEALNSEVRTRLDAAATESAGERARALRDAIRTVLAAESSDNGSAETLRALQAALAGRLSDQAEREFAEAEREEAGQLQGERDEIAAAVATELQSARAAVAAAREFRFASQGGPADIIRRVSHHSFDKQETILDISISPNGKQVLTGYSTGIALSDIDSGQEIHWFSRPNSSTHYLVSEHYSVAFALDGDFVTSNAGGYVWNTKTGKLAEFPQMNFSSFVIAVSPDGKMLMSGSEGRIVLWDIERGTRLGSFDMQESKRPSDVAFSPDGRYAAASHSSRSQHRSSIMWIWNVDTRQLVHRITADSSVLGQLSFTPDGNTLMGRVGKGIAMWDVTTGRQTRHIVPDDRTISDVAFSPDGNFALIGRRQSAELIDLTTGLEIRRFSTVNSIVALSFTPDGRYAVLGTLGGMKIWGPEE